MSERQNTETDLSFTPPISTVIAEQSTSTKKSDYCSVLPDDHWVVILLDPDGEDWSPWSVRAPNEQAAIQRARANWHKWLEDDALEEPEPDVIKVYRNSWIGERA